MQLREKPHHDPAERRCICLPQRMESKVGNVLREELAAVWNGNGMNGYRQYDRFIKCSRCELKTVCRGCPAVSYGYTHDPYGADPQCWKEV